MFNIDLDLLKRGKLLIDSGQGMVAFAKNRHQLFVDPVIFPVWLLSGFDFQESVNSTESFKSSYTDTGRADAVEKQFSPERHEHFKKLAAAEMDEVTGTYRPLDMLDPEMPFLDLLFNLQVE